MRSLHAHRPGPRAGMTLLEMTIAGALALLLASSAILAANGGYGAFRATQSATDVETRLRRTVDRVAGELMTSGVEELQPDPAGEFGTETLLFRRAIGLNGTQIVWGAQDRLALEPAPDDADDGIDNNADGRVDECELVWTRDVGGSDRRSVLCRGVREFLEGETLNAQDDNGNGVTDERGFSVQRSGDVLYVRLTLEEPGETGLILRTLETAVRLRN